TGPTVMFSHISERNIKSMLKGAVYGLLLISAFLIIALRSLRLGLLTVIPNLLPIGIAFGIWGLVVGQINVAASVVAGMVMGIIVDDTVHFMSKYVRARRESGLTAEQAIHFTLTTVGVALVVTSIVLVAGFMVLAQSNFMINATMGHLSAIGISTALFIDFLLLPPLLMLLDRKDYRSQRAPKEPKEIKTNEGVAHHGA
ncbi:MAG: MMPL family transporter, partial [Gammaproteobacteria bacterium]|nr:MMPL family transporter [Gammaproteobacteria bacterium]